MMEKEKIVKKRLSVPRVLPQKFKVTGIYSFSKLDEVKHYLSGKGIIHNDIQEVKMTLEDAFIGITGKY